MRYQEECYRNTLRFVDGRPKVVSIEYTEDSTCGLASSSPKP